MESLTLFLIDLHLNIVIDANNNDVGYDVECANCCEHSWVIEGDLLRDLHHHKDDDQVGARKSSVQFSANPMPLSKQNRSHAPTPAHHVQLQKRTNLHLWRNHFDRMLGTER